MSYEHLKASWRAEVEAIVRAELGKMESEIARMHHQVEQSFTQLLSQSAARLAAVSQDAAIADFAERAIAHMAAVSAAVAPAPAPADEVAAAPPTVEQAPPEQAPPTAGIDLQALYYYIIEIQSQQTQAEVLNLLVTRALEYAPRVALFVVKSGSVVAWSERGFEATGVSLRGLTIPLQAQTTLLAALEQQMAVLDSPYAYAENQLLLDRVGSVPEAMGGIPLLVRGKAAAVLYADAGDQPATSIALPPLQILVNVAGLTVELLNTRNRLATTVVPKKADTAPEGHAAEAAPSAATAAQPPADQAPPPETAQPAEAPATAAAATEEAYRDTAADHAEAAAPPADATTDAAPTEAPAQAEAPAETDYANGVAAETAPTAVEEAAPAASKLPDFTVTPTETAETEPTFVPQPIPPVVPQEPLVQSPITPPAVSVSEPPAPPVEPPASGGAPAWQMEAPAAVQDFTPPVFDPSQTEDPTPKSAPSDHSNGFEVKPLAPPPTAAPVATAAPPPAPPKPSTDEEIKAHNDARRFARLLVSEIKLYNEAKVTEGRVNRDLYDRLKEDIDRSRQMYDKRVNPIVAAKFDYFYDELVSSLAEGDSSRLGVDCPGPMLVQPE